MIKVVLSRTSAKLDLEKANIIAELLVIKITRRATHVFRKRGGTWLCLIDNSYGTDLLDGA